MTSFRESWVAPVQVWIASLVMAAIAGATLHAGATGARAVVPYVVFLSLTVLALLVVSRGQVQVRDGLLAVPGARIALAQLGDVRVLDREATRQLRGPLAQPWAFVATRSWLSKSVQVLVLDPEDDAPYWLIGSRRPEALAEALRRR